MYFVTGPDGQETGPVDLETLRTWIEGGRLPPAAPVRRAGGEPAPASSIEELKPLYQGRKAELPGTFGGLIPVGNPAALWGYYLGFLGLVPIVGALAVPFGIWQSIVGLRAHAADPSVRGRTHAWVGLILGLFDAALQTFFVVSIIAMTSAGMR